MKKIFVLLIFFIMFAFGGVSHALTLCTWTVSPTSHSFSSSAGSTAVTVTSNCSWPVTKSASWITLSKTSGSGNGTVTVGVLANSSIYSRSGTVTIGSLGLVKTFMVEQAGKFVPIPCTCSISPTSHSFSAFAGSMPVTVESNCSWPVTKSASWITLSKTSGTGNSTVTVGVLANPSIYSRSGTVTIGSLAGAKTFTVEQAASPINYSYEYFLPYYSSINVDWSGIALGNASNYHEVSIEIVARGTNGNLVSEIYKELPASGQTTFVIEDATGTGWVQVRSDQPLSGLAFLGHGSLMADIPFIDNLEQNLVIPHFAQDIEWDTTLLLCNPQSSSVSVNVISVNKQGIMVVQKSLTLAAKGSGSYLLGDFFEIQPLSGKIYLQATSGISAFALYSNVKSSDSYFAGINAVAESYIIK